ncbi:MAG TPA: hypothetical protein VKA73_09700 [Rubrobacter sp.]|nr:hypothetical protein [Rubrobacter sp.]
MDRSIEASYDPQALAHRGDAPLVLFAIEPHSYGQVIGTTVSHVRPTLDVRIVPPKDLVAELERQTPALVFSGESRPDGCDDTVRWVEYRPYEDHDVVRVDGRRHEIPELELEDLLALVDRLVGQGQRTARVIHHNPRAV